jgi:hypothetical protein
MDYKCIKCNKIYSGYQSLWIHNKKFHNNVQQISENVQQTGGKVQLKNKIKKSLICNYCNKTFNCRSTKCMHEKKCKNQKIIVSPNTIINNNTIENNIENIIENIGYIYIIQEREFYNLSKDIYKIGRTSNIMNRFKDYPKNSNYCYFRQTNKFIIDEKELINIFKNNFIQRKDIGTEYFEGNLYSMIKTINNYYDNTDIKTENEIILLTKLKTIKLNDYIKI